jgi:N-methylhydantoinase A
VAKQTSLVRAGVDIGGTFTDVALEVDGQIHSAKVLTDPALPDRAILEGLQTATGMAGIGLEAIGLIIHGTTLATNALIERRGACTGFITTAGFRDVLEMRTESRFEQYDLNIRLPQPLIERIDRLTLEERIDARGRVLIAPEQRDIEAICDRVAQAGYESVAIGFLHSYVNGAHERQLRDALARRLPGIEISISSEVSPQIREYERFNTVCANAYVKPLMKSYLVRLAGSLEALGANCPVFMMHSGGGIISVESAAEFPVRLIESGPAGGAIFAADIARRYGIEHVLSYDMGGTTAKICLIEDQVPHTAKTFEVARSYRFKKGSGMPISVPVVEMVEIGAGGGSIAGVDVLRQIRVGPNSAGSEPGPACYQRGGELPTVTDADLLLGRIDPNDFAGGSMILSPDLAGKAVKASIGAELGLDLHAAAYGICEVVDENMANAGRVHAVESGKNISDFIMITFGGAGPLHAARLCEKLRIDRFLVPPGAGVGSAIGFLRAPFSFEAVRSALTRLDAFDADAVNTILADMRNEALHFVRQGGEVGTPNMECTAYMRYVGQGWEIPVAIEADRFAPGDEAQIVDAFEAAYTRFFGRPVEGLAIEIVSWSVKATSQLPPVEPVKEIEPVGAATPCGQRLMFDSDTGGFVEAAVHAREALVPGASVTGPAIIVERETATIVTSAFQATVQRDGCLIVARI